MLEINIVKKGEISHYDFMGYQHYLLPKDRLKSLETMTHREFEQWQKHNNIDGYLVRIDYIK